MLVTDRMSQQKENGSPQHLQISYVSSSGQSYVTASGQRNLASVVHRRLDSCDKEMQPQVNKNNKEYIHQTVVN